MDKMKILVTGSSGTIGTRVSEKLLEKGYGVVGMDSKPNEWSKKVDGITINADLKDQRAFGKVPNGVGMIVHFAANALVYPLVVEPKRALDNMVMAFNALEYAREFGVKRFVFASSREVYGNTGQAVHKEEDAQVSHAESPYAAMKLAGEAMVHAYQQCYGIDFVIIRYSNVYGMYDSSDRLVPRCIRRARQGEELEVYGRDKMLDFTYIDDAAEGTAAAIERFSTAKNETYNLAAGKGVSILKVVELIKQFTASKSRIEVRKSRPGEVIKYVADISKARKRLGYEPKVGIEEGLKRSVEWYKTHDAFSGT